MYSEISKLVSNESNSESAYIPLVRQYIEACKAYEGPKEAALGVIKSLKRKGASNKDKQPKKKAAKVA